MYVPALSKSSHLRLLEYELNCFRLTYASLWIALEEEAEELKSASSEYITCGKSDEMTIRKMIGQDAAK